jgi:hypothetical protein
MAKKKIDKRELRDDGAIIKLQGREYLTHEGLLRVAHDHGVESILTELVNYDVEENQAIVKAIATGERGTYSGIGDASTRNVNSRIKHAVIRMAETRAVNRSLRLYLGIGMTSKDELPGDEKEAPPRQREEAPIASSHDDTPTKSPKSQETGSKKKRKCPVKHPDGKRNCTRYVDADGNHIDGSVLHVNRKTFWDDQGEVDPEEADRPDPPRKKGPELVDCDFEFEDDEGVHKCTGEHSVNGQGTVTHKMDNRQWLQEDTGEIRDSEEGEEDDDRDNGNVATPVWNKFRKKILALCPPKMDKDKKNDCVDAVWEGFCKVTSKSDFNYPEEPLDMNQEQADKLSKWLRKDKRWEQLYEKYAVPF